MAMLKGDVRAWKTNTSSSGSGVTNTVMVLVETETVVTGERGTTPAGVKVTALVTDERIVDRDEDDDEDEDAMVSRWNGGENSVGLSRRWLLRS